MDSLFEKRPKSLENFGDFNGVYLDVLEVQNWGPFTNRYCTSFASLSALVIGENGTGKSSLMDGVLTLLVSNVKYNNATDSKGRAAGRRELREYVLGFKESTRDDDTGSKRTDYLREDGAITILLLRFRAGGKYYTIGNVMTARRNEQNVSRQFLFKEGILTIVDFPPNAPSFGEYCKKIGQLDGVTCTSDRSKYSIFLREKLGLDGNAMKLLSTISSEKSLGSDINPFIRKYMFLENNNFRADFNSLGIDLTALERIVKGLEEAREKDSLLSAIVPNMRTLCTVRKDLSLWRSSREKIVPFLYRIAKSTAEEEMRSAQLKNSQLLKKKEMKIAERESCLKTKYELEFQRKNHGGLAIQQKENEKEVLENKYRMRLQLRNGYMEKAGLAGVAVDFSDEQTFSQTLTAVQQTKDSVFQKAATASNDLENAKKLNDEAGNILRRLEAERRELETKHASIPRDLVDFRDKMCSALGIDNSVMPFLGEYLSVTDKAWIPALEHLLRHDSESFLVPSEYGKDVSSFIRKSGSYGISYRLMTPVNRNFDPDPKGAWTKISVRKDMPYADWVEQYIQKTAYQRCCDTDDEFSISRNAIMQNGLTRRGDHKHWIDRKEDIMDSRKFRMSGSYLSRLEFLAEDIKKAKEDKTVAEKNIAKAANVRDELEKQRKLLEQLPFIPSFEDISISKLEIEIRECERVLETLRNSKDIRQFDMQLEQVGVRIDSIQKEISSTEEEISKSDKEIGALQGRMDDHQKLLDVTVFNEEEEKILTALYEKRKPNSLHPKYETVMDSHSLMARDITKKDQEMSKEEADVGKEVKGNVTYFFEKWPSYKNELPAVIEKEEDMMPWAAEYENIHDDALPAANKNVSEWVPKIRNCNFYTFIFNLTHDVERRVQRIIDCINRSLHHMNYTNDVNPTFLHMDCKRTKNPEVVELRRLLQNAADLVDNETKPADMLITFNRLFEFIKENVDNTNSEAYNPRNILDIRNWFEYPVAECRWAENGKDFYHVKELDQIAKQSGGEGVKLTYFIQAACYSMWMHIYDDEYTGNSFRFLMIDEIDTKISPTNLQDVIALFHSLNIQLVSLLPISDKVSQYEGYVGNIICTGYTQKPESYIDTVSYADYISRNRDKLKEKIKRGKDAYYGKNLLSE